MGSPLAAAGRFRVRGKASEAERPPEAMRFPTAILAIRRTVGWISQWKQMITDPTPKIGRPRQLYSGPTRRITSGPARADR